MNQRADRRFRVTGRKDIQRLFDLGRRAADATVTLVGAPNELGHSRAAVGTSGRHGKAFRRNRIRRLCREAFRLTRARLPSGYDYMIIPRVGVDHSLEALNESLRALAPRVAAGGGQ